MNKMVASLRIVACLGLCALIGVVIDFTYSASGSMVEVTRTLKISQGTLSEAQKSIQLTREHLDRDLTVIGVAASAMEKTAKEAQGSSVEQRKYWAQSSMEITKTIESLNAAIQHTDQSINRDMVPAVIETVRDTHQVLLATADSIEAINEGIKPTLEHTAEMTAQATRLLSDAHITESLTHIDDATDQIAKTTAHVEQTAEGLERYVQTLTKPANLAVRVLKTTGQILGSFGVFIKGLL